MKTRALVLWTLIALLMTGCIVKSLHPFYNEENVIYDKSLLGSWTDEDSARWEIRPFAFPKGFMKEDSLDNSYLVILYEEEKEPAKFNAHLFKVGDNMYLDFVPLRNDRDEGFFDLHLISAHSLALVSNPSPEKLSIAWFNEEWLGKLFEENRVKISHEVVMSAGGNTGKEYILTASTDELQKFILKYANPREDDPCVDNDNFLCVQLTKTD